MTTPSPHLWPWGRWLRWGWCTSLFWLCMEHLRWRIRPNLMSLHMSVSRREQTRQMYRLSFLIGFISDPFSTCGSFSSSLIKAQSQGKRRRRPSAAGTSCGRVSSDSVRQKLLEEIVVRRWLRRRLVVVRHGRVSSQRIERRD